MAINFLYNEAIRSVELLNCFFIFKSYNSVSVLCSILQNAADVWLGFTYKKNQNQLDTKRRKRNSDGLCKSHMLSQTSIIVDLEIQQASMLLWKPSISSQICCTKVFLDGYSNMLKLVQRGFLFWGTQNSLLPSSFTYGQCSMTFWDILKGECCGAYFTPNVTNWKQQCDLRVIAA